MKLTSILLSLVLSSSVFAMFRPFPVADNSYVKPEMFRPFPTDQQKEKMFRPFPGGPSATERMFRPFPNDS
jgi:hypothetical protein